MATRRQEENDKYYRAKITSILAKRSLRKAKRLLEEVNSKIKSNQCSPWLGGDPLVRDLRLFVMTGGKGLPGRSGTPSGGDYITKSPGKSTGKPDGFQLHWTIKLLILIVVILYIIGND